MILGWCYLKSSNFHEVIFIRLFEYEVIHHTFLKIIRVINFVKKVEKNNFLFLLMCVKSMFSFLFSKNPKNNLKKDGKPPLYIFFWKKLLCWSSITLDLCNIILKRKIRFIFTKLIFPAPKINSE